MEFLKARPAASAAAGFIAVSLIGYYAFAYANRNIVGIALIAASALFFTSAVAFVILAFLAARKPSKLPNRVKTFAAYAAVCGCCGTAALLSQVYFGFGAQKLDTYADGEGHSATFTVTEINKISSYDASYTIEVTAIDGSSPGVLGRVYAELDADFVLDLGLYNVYTLENVIFSSPEYDSPSDAAYAAAQGIRTVLTVSEDESGSLPVSLGERKPLLRFFSELNSALSNRLIIGLGKDDGGLTSCLLLGRWENLGGTLSRDFRALGILHLLAISGEHLSVLLGGLELLLRRFNKYIRFSVLALGAVMILALTGMSASVARAAVMSVLYYAAFLLRRRSDSVTSLFGATALILAVSPAAAADLGLIMSFSSTLGIITLGKTLTQRGKLRIKAAEFVRANLINSLCATAFTLPVSWLLCGQFALLSPISTLVFTLPFTALLYVTPFAIILFGTPLFAVAATAASILCSIVTISSKYCANLFNGTVVSMRYPFVWIAFAAAVVVIFILPKLKIKLSGTVKVIALFAVFAAVFSASFGIYSFIERDTAKVIYYNSGTNDMFAMESKGMTLLCDVSDGSYTPAKKAVKLAVDNLYAVNLDGYLLTHLHRRHVTQFSRLASRYFIRVLILPRPFTEDERLIAKSLEAAALEYGTQVLYYGPDDGGSISLGGLELKLPERKYIKRSAHPAVTMLISGSDTDILYMSGGAYETEDKKRLSLLGYYADSAEGIIIGAHIPQIKKEIPFTSIGSLKLAVFPTAEVREAVALTLTDGAESVTFSSRGINSMEFKLKNGK